MVNSRAGTPDPIGCGAAKCSLDEEGVRRTGSNPSGTVDEFKNVYSLDFLGLPDGHSEADLHGALLRNLGRFITELGRDFCFVGSAVPGPGRQPGLRDRPRVLPPRAAVPVAFELKVEKFKPERPRPAQLLRGGPRSRREEAARAALHRRSLVREQGRRGRRVRAGPHHVSHARRRVPDRAAAEGACSGPSSTSYMRSWRRTSTGDVDRRRQLSTVPHADDQLRRRPNSAGHAVPTKRGCRESRSLARSDPRSRFLVEESTAAR